MSIKDAIGKIDEAITDLSSLHVQTYTGSMSVDLSKLAKGESAMDKVRKTVTAESEMVNGSITLVAEAYYQFDGDSYNFLTSDTVPPRALELHTAAVEAGIATRKGLVELVKGLF
jgi:hypothetical protein